MEPAVRSTAAPALPVAWLEGDVLAEYLRFLELDEEAAPAPAPRPTRVPVAWLHGEVRDEFLRFLEESSASGGVAAVPACPELQEDEEYKSAPHGSDDDDVGFDGHGDGVVVDDDDDYESFVDDVLAEYLRFLELDEKAAPAPERRPARVPVEWLQGEVRDEFLRFLQESAASSEATVAACPELQDEDGDERANAPHGSYNDVDDAVVDVDNDCESFVDDEGGFVGDDDEDGDDDDACVMEYRSEEGGVVFTMDTEELDDDPVLELLWPHILDLPALRARAAVAGMVRQQSPRAFPRQGGWMSSNDDDDEMTNDDESFPRQDGRMRSQLLRRRIQDLQARYRACVAEAEAVQQQLSLAFPRHQDGWMSSDNDDEMADELPRQDDGWMGSDDDEEMTTDEFTGNRNRLQLRHTY